MCADSCALALKVLLQSKTWLLTVTGNCSSNMLSLRRVDSVARPSCNQSFNCGQLFMIHDTSKSQRLILHTVNNKLLVILFLLYIIDKTISVSQVYIDFQKRPLSCLFWSSYSFDGEGCIFQFFCFTCAASVVTTQTIASLPGWFQLLQNIRKHSTGTYPCWPTWKQKIMVQHLGWRPLLGSFGSVSSQMV